MDHQRYDDDRPALTDAQVDEREAAFKYLMDRANDIVDAAVASAMPEFEEDDTEEDRADVWLSIWSWALQPDSHGGALMYEPSMATVDMEWARHILWSMARDPRDPEWGEEEDAVVEFDDKIMAEWRQQQRAHRE